MERMTYSCLKNVATGRGRKRVNSDTDSVREGAPFRRAAPQPVGMVVQLGGRDHGTLGHAESRLEQEK